MDTKEQKNTERNFRASYYEKVGCSVVEEKKSLKFLEDNVRNLEKLKQFCRYQISFHQRLSLWSIILGVHPLHKNSTEYILEQRKTVADDLLRGVTALGVVDASTPKSQVMHAMWLLENNRLLHPGHAEDSSNFEAIVKVLLKIYDNCSDVETYWIYWIAKEFYEQCAMEIKRECPRLKEITQSLLKEDLTLYNHLCKLDIFSNNGILDKLYASCFAGIISESSLIKCWDKICGGSRKIVIFIFSELVKTFSQSIMNGCSNQKEFKAFIEQIKDQEDVIVNKAIKTWQNHKHHSEITVH